MNRNLGPQWGNRHAAGVRMEGGGTQPPKGDGLSSCEDCGAQFPHAHAPNEIYGYRFKGRGGGLAGQGGTVWEHLDRSLKKQYGRTSPFGNPDN